jgi:hypothetical protein
LVDVGVGEGSEAMFVEMLKWHVKSKRVVMVVLGTLSARRVVRIACLRLEVMFIGCWRVGGKVGMWLRVDSGDMALFSCRSSFVRLARPVGIVASW